MKKLAFLLILLFIQTQFYSQTKEFSFHVEIKGKGRPIVLIPGLASSGKVWEQTTKTLEKNYECHILTLPGFANQTPITLNKGFLPVIKDEIIKYIQTNFHQKPILIGHSLGGFLSLSIASSNPDLLKEIVIVDSYPFMAAAYNPNATEENVISQANMMKKMLLNTPEKQFLQQQKNTMATMITDSTKIKVATKWSLISDRKTIAQAMYELMTTDLRKDIEKVKIPILVLGSWYGGKNYGVTKEMVLKNYKQQFSKAENVTITIANTAKHFIMWDEPKWFINSVKSFINDAQ
ncbi:alpha/beta fold hydrolase [Tenacibaculum amylolyticum]|uniref:alpha/beta fold hydrolase n=1 Tax=Tenacibaculum amylolyticum TaxID=104269 RepID=UPI003896055F